MSTTRMSLEGRVFRRYWGWIGGLVLIIWTGSIALGIGLGPVLPELPHLGLVATALFVGLLVPRLTSRPAIVAALVGGERRGDHLGRAAVDRHRRRRAGRRRGGPLGEQQEHTATDQDQEN